MRKVENHQHKGISKHIRFFILANVLSAFALSHVWAQQVTFKAQVPKTVLAGKPFQLTYVLNAEGENFQAGDFGAAVSVLQGPSVSTSSSIQIINGQMSKSIQNAFIFYLKIDKEGIYTLPKATVKVDGEKYTSDAVSVEVVKNTQPSNANPQNADVAPSDEADIASEDLFLRLQLNKSQVVVGEPVLATIKVYTRVSLSGYEDLRLPAFNGLWKEDLEMPQQINLEREEVNGVPYNVGVLKQFVLFPQRAGQISLEGVEMDCIVRLQQQRRRRDPFNDPFGDPFGMMEDFFGRGYQNVRKTIASPAAKLNVKPLPNPQPSGFSGAVGDFNLEASIDKTSVKANEPITLKLKISGTGNLKLAEAPKLQFPADFEVYEPKTSDAVRTSASGYSGSKSVEYIVIPRSHGSFNLSELQFAFFNPSKNAYETRTVGPFALTVERGEGMTDAPQIASNNEQSAVSALGSDIRYLKTGAIELREKGDWLFGSALFWLSFALPSLAFGGFLLWRKKLAAEQADAVGTRHRKAAKMAQKRLEKAAALQKEGKKDAFYKEVVNAIWGYLGDKLTLPLADLTKERAQTELQARGVAENLTQQLTQFMDDCEFAQFAPSAGAGGLGQVYEQAVQLIAQIDGQIGKSKRTVGNAALLLLPLLGTMLALPAPAQNEQQWLQQAEQAYAQQDFVTAAAQYEQVLQSGKESFEVYYNLGNAYFKQNRIGEAILAYERAKKLNPTDEDLLHNLAFMQQYTKDRFETVPSLGFSRFLGDLAGIFHADTWAISAIVSFALLLLGMGIFLTTDDGPTKRRTLYLSALWLFLALLTFGVAFRQYQQLANPQEAVVLAGTAPVKSMPDTSGVDLFLLHEGTKVALLEQKDGWLKVKLPDGNIGWMPPTTAAAI